MHATIQKAAEAIEPRAFIGTPDDIHLFCSPIRVDVAQERIIAKAKSSLRAALQSGVLAEVRDALDELSKLGNGKELGNSVGNLIAQDAIIKLDKLMKELE